MGLVIPDPLIPLPFFPQSQLLKHMNLLMSNDTDLYMVRLCMVRVGLELGVRISTSLYIQVMVTGEGCPGEDWVLSHWAHFTVRRFL